MSYLAEAVAELRPESEFYVIDDELIWNDDLALQPTTDEITLKVREIEKRYFVEDLNLEIDNKTKYVQNLLAGKEITPEQVERYKHKYEIAISTDPSQLQLEADLLGIPLADLQALIVSIYNDWDTTLKQNLSRQDAIRVALTARVDIDDILLLQYKLDQFKLKDFEMTDLEITDLINLTSIPTI